MIDIYKEKESLESLLLDGLRRFERENPNVIWSAIAFDSCPRYGWVAINFDTKENSDRAVTPSKHNDPDWFAKDKWGTFNNNCADFKFCEFSKKDIPEWEEAFINISNDARLSVIGKNGSEQIINVDIEGDGALDSIVFDLLKDIVVSKKLLIKNESKNRSLISRIGVQICDSAYEYFDVI